MPIFLDVGHRHIARSPFGFRFPVTGDIFLIGFVQCRHTRWVSFPGISVSLYRHQLGSGPDPLIDIAGTGDLLLGRFHPSAARDSGAPPVVRIQHGTGAAPGVGNVETNRFRLAGLTSGSSGVSGRRAQTFDLRRVQLRLYCLRPLSMPEHAGSRAGQSLRRRECRCGRRLRRRTQILNTPGLQQRVGSQMSATASATPTSASGASTARTSAHGQHRQLPASSRKPGLYNIDEPG